MANTRTKTPRSRAPAALTNGQYHGPIPPPPMEAGRMPRTEVWVPLAVEYPGWHFLFWRNHPQILRVRFRSATTESERRAVLNELVRAHNGWLDTKGEKFPPCGTDEFWETIPTEVAATIWVRINEECHSLPNSLTPTPISSIGSSEPSPSVETVDESASPTPTSDDN